MEEKRIKSALPIYAFGVFFVAFSLIFPVFRINYFVIALLLSFAFAIVIRKLAPDKIIMVEAEYRAADTGDSKADKLILEGRASLKELKRLSAKIDNTHVLRDLDELKEYTDKIFNHLEEHPEKVNAVRQFMNYYLPTAIKLTENYVSLKDEKAAGENIVRATAKIEEALDKSVDAFKKQFDNLFEAEAMDIIAEVNVMEKLLKAEGLIDGANPFKKGGGK